MGKKLGGRALLLRVLGRGRGSGEKSNQVEEADVEDVRAGSDTEDGEARRRRRREGSHDGGRGGRGGTGGRGDDHEGELNIDCTIVSRRSVREAVERMQCMVEERQRVAGIRIGENDGEGGGGRGNASEENDDDHDKDEATCSGREDDTVAGEMTGACNDDICDSGNDMTLPTLPKVHERLANNAAALPLKSIMSNIDRHIARTQTDNMPRVYDHNRSFARAKSGGTADAGSMRGASAAAASFSKTAADVGVNVSEMEGDIDDIDSAYDDGRALICNSTPSAVVEVFTHQGDHEAFATEEMLQSVCGQLPACAAPSVSTSSVSPLPTPPAPDANATALSSPTINGLNHQGEILRLTYHVDIWDSSHFRDSLATKAHSQRQKNYGVRLGLRYLFVPQVIINGRASVAGSGDATRTAATLRQTLAEHPLDANRAFIFMRLINEDRRIEAFLTAAKDADASGTPPTTTAASLGAEAPDLFLVLFHARKGTRIGRINRARRGNILEECNVVRSCTLLRKWSSGKPLCFTFTLPRDIDGAALLLQQHSNGALITAASIEPGAVVTASRRHIAYLPGDVASMKFGGSRRQERAV